jgi:RHS repeat-associated protein
LNATGGLDGLADDFGIFKPVIADARGNILASYEPASGEVVWNMSRPTGYGAVPEYRPVALADNGDVAAACAWRGRWPDLSGLYWFGSRYYDPVAGRFISFDPVYDQLNPCGYSFAGGDPINYFDADGRLGKSASPGSIMALLEHERFVNQYLTPKLTFEEAIWGLYGVAGSALNLPYAMAEGIANDLDTAIYGRSFDQYGLMEQATTWQRVKSGGMAVLPFVPVGTIADAGIQGIRGLSTGLRLADTFVATSTGARGVEAVGFAAERTAVQLEFPFARGASVQTPGVTTAGETFVRVGAGPQNLKFGSTSLSGAQPGTYAFPEATFNSIGQNPAALKNFGDLPGAAPQYFRVLQPPAGTPIQRGIVPGGQFGGAGGVPEVIFPKGF